MSDIANLHLYGTSLWEEDMTHPCHICGIDLTHATATARWHTLSTRVWDHCNPERLIADALCVLCVRCTSAIRAGTLKPPYPPTDCTIVHNYSAQMAPAVMVQQGVKLKGPTAEWLAGGVE